MAETWYPLTFHPRLIEKIWGGRKLETVLGKALPAGRMFGESWEICDFPPGVAAGTDAGPDGWVSSEVANGPLTGRTLHQLLSSDAAGILGTVPLLQTGSAGGQFPLLVKYLDAREDLSVQVHPTAAYAAHHSGAHLKTETWYVVQHDHGARLLQGLVDGVTPDLLRESMAKGTIERTIASHYVHEGECYFLPSGMVHALGEGILAAEVQTPSDTTFRLYDFNRIEAATGKPRKLHLDESLACIEFGRQEPPRPVAYPVAHGLGQAERLCGCGFFTLDRVRLGGTAGRWSGAGARGMAIWMVVSGACRLSWTLGGVAESLECRAGRTVLIPAGTCDFEVSSTGPCTILESRIPA